MEEEEKMYEKILRAIILLGGRPTTREIADYLEINRYRVHSTGWTLRGMSLAARETSAGVTRWTIKPHQQERVKKLLVRRYGEEDDAVTKLHRF